MSLILKNVKKVYQQGEIEVKALKGINLNVNTGEFISVIGDSGSGKTTLLNIIGGIDHQTSGDVILDTLELKNLNEEKLTEYRRKNIGFIFQNYNLIPILNVRENIILPLNLDGKEVDEEYLDEILELLEIEEKTSAFPNQLSGGQQQRVAIARALICKPKIILADEPTGNLDQRNSQNIIELFVRMNKKFNQTIIMITHNLELTRHCDRVIRIIDGEIVEVNKNER
ncbi:MAG: ABC transporter ATP-binding protein [Tissierellia bacterium]|nr:ABC transporter ATP-binding protein [Tissierellia bacterium]